MIDNFMVSVHVPIEMRIALLLTVVHLGMAIHKIKIIFGKGGHLARAVGVITDLIVKKGKSTMLKSPFGDVLLISRNC